MSLLDIIGSIIGLLYIISEYRAGRWFWPLSLLMSAFYIVINFLQGYYANFSICIYNFLMSIYGLLVWRGLLHSKDRQERPITSAPARLWPWLIALVVSLALLFHWLLGVLNESSMPWLDGISAALSIVGMWMCSQKYWQQWFFWMIVEPLMVILYLKSGLYASAILYVVFEVFCILGVLRWRREAQVVPQP